MKIQSILTSCLLIVFTIANNFAQKLNKYGHFTPTQVNSIKYKLKTTENGVAIELEKEKLILKGNSVFKTQNGFVTLDGSYENAPSTIRQYTKNGEEIFAQTFPQTINFTLNQDKNKCVFHDMKQIQSIDLMTHEIKNYSGTNVFSINNLGQLAYYDDVNSSIIFKAISKKIDEQVYKILFFKDEPLYVTKSTIYCIKNELTEVVFKNSSARIFDVSVFNDKLYISTKKETPGEFIFNSFSTIDLNTFQTEEEIHYSLNNTNIKKTNTILTQEKNNASQTNESILDPIDYYNDSVYQQVGNSYCEIQEYGVGFLYLHPGVDLLGDFTQNVRSVKKGYVKAILTTSAQYHWRIAIANQNTSNNSQGYLYAHLEETSFPYAVGDSVNAGDVIGYLVDFPVSGFVHCHFARIACQGNTWSGDWATFDNPLSYMSNFFDSIPPEFEKTINNDPFAFRNTNGNYLSPDSLYGNLKVISKVFDRINSNWHCDVNRLEYSISPLTSPNIMLLDSFSYEYNFFNDNYYSTSYNQSVLRTLYSRDATCFSTADYNNRDFYHIITNSNGNDTIEGVDSLQLFNTYNLPNNSYIFRVTASDPSGNTTSDSMIVKIKNGSVGLNDLEINSHIKIYPNPFSNSTTITTTYLLKEATLIVYNSVGQIVKKITGISGHKIILDREDLGCGLYFIQLQQDEKKIVSEKIVIID